VHTWRGAEGLVEDILYYGQWMHEQAVSRIGWLYPDILVTDELANLDSHLSDYRGKKLTVVAWIWARTVKSPNPAFSHVLVPLASTFVLSSRKGKEVWLEPTVDGDSYRFKVRYGRIPESANDGTKLGRGANFQCILSGTPLEPDYIKREGTAGRMGVRLLAVVCDGGRGRVYIEPSNEQEKIAFQARPEWKPEQELNYDPRAIWTPAYGLKRYCDLFTDRQLTALGCFAGLVAEVHDRILKDCARHARSEDFRMSSDEQQRAYAAAVATYLGLTVSRLSNSMNALAVWSQSREQSVNLFSRQAIPMAWDFPEVNPFSGAAGDFLLSVRNVCKCIPSTHTQGWSFQADASTQRISETKVISTDPPYYDNVGYADLSDFFYVWQRKCLRSVYSDLFSTMTVPKAEELVAAPYRHGGKSAAEDFFLTGMTAAMENIVKHCNGAFPITIYYAFRQSESRSDGLSSTGWETFLEAVLNAGLALHGTWPMRTERPTGVKHAVNALASSIVLVCVKRATTAGMTTRRDFQSQLRKEMPVALRNLQHGNIAPVDMAQSSIGPGMAIFSRYNKVVEADGSPMKVRTALALINEALDEILAEQEGELDACSRWAVAWFSDYGTGEGPFGRADDLSRAKNTSVDGLQRAGIVYAKAGKVNLLRREELDADWDPAADARLTVWEAAQHLIRTLERTGEPAAANLLTKLGGLADQARDLAYRLYNTCERKGWAEEARSYNGLVMAWPELVRLAAQEPARPKMAQGELAYEEE
jgi:putative DNA methylase